MTPFRESIFAALFSLVSQGEGLPGLPGVNWGAGPSNSFVYTSRRVRDFSELPSQPALCQAEHMETSVQQTSMPSKRTFMAKWIVYHQAGKNASAVPTSTNNNILDALEAAIAPQMSDPGFLAKRNTLGGLVSHCFIGGGNIFKDPGDLDNQALLVVPITILVP